MNEATTDGRLLKGARARASIARHAADVASVEGLTGLSLGRLASDLGVSKSGVATLFGTKENLQLAAVQAAREVFVDSIVRPALEEASGLPRLWSLIDRWFDYACEPAFPGGCFRAATIAEFDSRPGAVRDALARDRDEWLGLLTREVARAQEASPTGVNSPPGEVAFEIDAVLGALNTALRMEDDEAVERARAILGRILARL